MTIWKTPDQKPDIDKQILIINDFGYVIYFGKCAVAPGNKWCYVDDLIAQADKAERLEKENKAMREEFEVWHGNHKCVLEDNERLQKIAERQNDILQDYFATLGYNIGKEVMDMSDEIKQLIKE